MSMSERANDAQEWALVDAAAAVLRRNDLGGRTRAAPRLYPHQWSWDSAFIAIGWAALDPGRAAQELRTLFAAQWASGMLPHIVFDPAVPPGAYFPDAAYWDCQRLAEAAPRAVQTSGLCQPPVHALAVRRIWAVAEGGDAATRAAGQAFVRESYPHLLAWHRYLATARDPEGSGLVTIVHPWESGMDNAPRWDSPFAAVVVGDLPPYTRADLQHVADPAQRPTPADYDRYLWLVEVLKRARYDDAAVQRAHPFRVKDVFFSAILVAANVALLELAVLSDAPEEERVAIAGWIARGRQGQEAQWEETLGLGLDRDARTGQALVARTVAGFAPLLAGDVPADRRAALLTTLDSAAFLGHPGLRWRVPPSTSPADPAFQPRSYWRGPTWPVITWLLWWALVRDGEAARAARLRQAALAQVQACGFAEYVEPFTGEPLGSQEQSWTAAVTLDWLVGSGAPRAIGHGRPG